MVERRLATALFLMIGSALIWAGTFLFSYVFSALECSESAFRTTLLGFSGLPVALAAASFAAFAGFAALSMPLLRARRGGAVASSGELPPMAVVMCALSAIAVLWNAFPLFLLAGRC